MGECICWIIPLTKIWMGPNLRYCIQCLKQGLTMQNKVKRNGTTCKPVPLISLEALQPAPPPHHLMSADNQQATADSFSYHFRWPTSHRANPLLLYLPFGFNFKLYFFSCHLAQLSQPQFQVVSSNVLEWSGVGASMTRVFTRVCLSLLVSL